MVIVKRPVNTSLECKQNSYFVRSDPTVLWFLRANFIWMRCVYVNNLIVSQISFLQEGSTPLLNIPTETLTLLPEQHGPLQMLSLYQGLMSKLIWCLVSTLASDWLKTVGMDTYPTFNVISVIKFHVIDEVTVAITNTGIFLWPVGPFYFFVPCIWSLVSQ